MTDGAFVAKRAYLDRLGIDRAGVKAASIRAPARRAERRQISVSVNAGPLQLAARPRSAVRQTGGVLTVFGVLVLTFMMLMYALERRGARFVLAFACGCALASVYGFLAGTWPFGVVEGIWCMVALRRFRRAW